MLEVNQIPFDAIEPVLTLTRQQAYLAFSSQTEPREVAKWQNAFDDMEKDGTADKIRNKYGFAPLQTIQFYTEDYPPQNYLQDGVLVGPAVEIIRQLLYRSTTGSRITVVSWSRGYRDTMENPNTALFSTARTPERENLFQWVGPITHTKVVFLARKGSGITITSLADAKKVKSIGAYRDDTNEQFLTSNGFTNLDTDVSPEFVPKKLAAGRLDLWITPIDTSSYLLRKAGLDPNDFEVLFTVREFDGYLAVSLKTAPALVQHWQETLDQMRKEGIVEQILKNADKLP
jgi:polar amino acid transport system substrate-binding protein